MLEEYYEDNENGGFFMTGTDQETLIAREKPGYDGAEPSGNSVAVMNLMRLYEFTTEQKFYKRAENTLRAFLGNPQSNHVALSEMLLALDFFLDIAKEIIIVTLSENKEMAEPFLAELRKLFMPNAILIVVSEGKDMETLSTVIPAVKGKLALDGKTTAYVCEKGICKLPTVDPSAFSKQISRVEPYWEAVRG